MELCNYPCPNKIRYYEIEAIQIPIVYNKYGDHDPNGLLYVLMTYTKLAFKENGLQDYMDAIEEFN